MHEGPVIVCVIVCVIAIAGIASRLALGGTVNEIILGNALPAVSSIIAVIAWLDTTHAHPAVIEGLIL